MYCFDAEETLIADLQCLKVFSFNSSRLLLLRDRNLITKVVREKRRKMKEGGEEGGNKGDKRGGWGNDGKG